MAKQIKFPKWLLVILIGVALVFGACAVYVSIYYKADKEAITAFSSDFSVPKTVWEDETVVFCPENPIAGFIFYPGGKVEHTAYEPLAQALAENGVLTVLVKMPFRLAVLDINAADGIRETFPEIHDWYIGGHSLGGSMAASYLEKNASHFRGLVLLGSYSTADLSATDLGVLSIYGSEDGVLNMEKYLKNKENLPSDFSEIVLEGGCHAYFGMYGSQKGDGVPTLTNKEQIDLTVNAILSFVLE